MCLTVQHTLCVCVCVLVLVCACIILVLYSSTNSYLITSCTAWYQQLCLMATTINSLLLLGEEVHQIDEQLLASGALEALWMPCTGIPKLVGCSNIHIAILYWLETVKAHLENVYNIMFQSQCIGHSQLKIILKTIQ